MPRRWVWPDKHQGQEIMACIVLRPGCQPTQAEIRDFCELRLGRFKTPNFLYFVDDLPRGPAVPRAKCRGSSCLNT